LSKSRAVRRWFKPTTPLSNTFPAALRGTGTRTGAGYDPNFKTGYYQHWNLGVERSYVYDLPFGPGGRFASNLSGVAGKIVGGWEISGIYVARSGQPFTPSWSGDIANIGGTSVRPNVVGDWRLENPTPQQWWNPAAFAAPAPGTFGNAGRNILTGPSYWNTDFSLMKNTRFAEGKNLQLRFEFFNAMNHANFDPPTTTVNGGTFGRVTTANQNLQNARQIQLGAKIQF